MIFIKYLFLAIISLGIFVLAVFDIDAKDFMYKGGIILAFIIGLLILNFFARIAWKILMLIIFIALLLFALNYFGVLEVSSDGFSDFSKKIVSVAPETTETGKEK